MPWYALYPGCGTQKQARTTMRAKLEGEGKGKTYIRGYPVRYGVQVQTRPGNAKTTPIPSIVRVY